jgi:tyrosine-protein kinase Etk/Wzc
MQQPPINTVTQNESEEIDLLDLLGTLIDYKFVIAGITSVFMIGGLAYAILAAPVFRANAIIQVEPKKNDVLGFNDMSSLLGGESPSGTEIELIKSRSVLGKAIDNLKLDILSEPNYFPVFGRFIAKKYTGDTPDSIAKPWFGMNGYNWGGESLTVFKLDVPPGLLGEELTLTSKEKGNYDLFDEDGNLLVSGHVGTKTESNGIEILVSELRANPGATFSVMREPRLNSIKDYQEALDVSERGKDSGILGLALESTDPKKAVKTLNEIARLYVRQNVERTSAEAAASLDFLKQQLPQVRKDLEEAEDALNKYQTRSKSIDISLETKAILDQIVALDTSISELKLQQAEMDRKFTAQHPAYRALLSKIDELSSKQSGLSKRVESLPATQQELLSLTRDVQVSTEIYTQLLNRSQELDIVRAGSVGNVHIVDDADVDLREPVRPKKALVVLMATLLGGFLSIIFVMLRRAINRGIESAELIEQLGLPVYASVPFSTLQKSAETSSKKTKAESHAQILAISQPTDLAVEAVRSLRTSLHFAMLEAKNNRLMISGPSPSVGKTFVSSNLAALIAQSGKRVLIVDVDMRKGYLHKSFGKPAEKGLSDILTSRCSLNSALHETEVPNLFLISRGQTPPNPAELLMHRNFTNFLEEASEQFDLVILDTPPILAVTDAAIVGRHSGTSMIVTRFGMNPVGEIKLTIRRFAQNGVVLKGAILNYVEKRATSKTGYNSYGYYQYSYVTDKK